MSPSLSFQVLGSLKVSVDGRPLTLRSARQRAVLAVLLLTPGRVVSVQSLAEAVWHSDPPATVRNQIAICVSALRKTLRDEAGVDGLIETVLPGYVLHAEGHYVDLLELHQCIASARAAAEAGDPAAAGRFEYALSLWSGPVLDGMDGGAIDGAVSRLTELRLDLAEEHAALLLQQGRYRAVVAGLAPVVAEHPLREQARAVLMQAYYLSGRRSEALECYREGRQILVAELGVEPGAELQELHRTVLEGIRPRGAGRERAPAARPPSSPANSRASPNRSSAGRPNWTCWSACWSRRTAIRRCGSRRSAALPGSARARSPCSGRTAAPSTSRTASFSWTSRASTSTAPRPARGRTRPGAARARRARRRDPRRPAGPGRALPQHPGRQAAALRPRQRRLPGPDPPAAPGARPGPGTGHQPGPAVRAGRRVRRGRCGTAGDERGRGPGHARRRAR